MADADYTGKQMESELLHTYAKNDGSCPNTWKREAEEWQFDGLKKADDGRECDANNAPGEKAAQSALGQHAQNDGRARSEHKKWLPAT